MVLRPAYDNPYGDPLIGKINESFAKEDLEYEAMFGEDRWNYFEKYCKAHLEDYLRWVWENREKED